MSIFKYPLRINTEKHPEVYAALKQAQQKDGIAFYIRKLIERDIEMKKNKEVLPIIADTSFTNNNQHEPLKNNSFVTVQSSNSIEKSKSSAIDENDDFGGGLA